MYVFKFIVIFLQIITIFGKCKFDRYFSGDPQLILTPVDDDYLIPPRKDIINIPNDGYIIVFCSEGFHYKQSRYTDWGQQITESDSTGNKLLEIGCSDNEFYLKSSYDSEKKLENIVELACNIPSPNYCSAPVRYCQKGGFVYGVSVQNISIVLAEFCYNFNKSEIGFVHYLTSKRSQLLSEQENYNPNKFNSILNNTLKMYLDERNSSIDINYMVPVQPYLQPVMDQIDFEYDEIVPSTVYSSLLKGFFGKTQKLATIPWWRPLKNGNWKIFENILKRRSSKQDFEVYVGKSHQVSYPKSFICDSNSELLTFEMMDEEKHIPLYIWQYIKSLSEEKNETSEFVLMAVNSPFFTKEDVICNDICNTIDWLKPLEITRKLANFGYMFCCKRENVQKLLDGFPLLE